MKKIVLFLFVYYIVITKAFAGILVLQSDFGLKDSAVAEMKGVALQVDKDITIVDNTHLINQFDVWDGAYRLFQSIKTFPKNTVFVSVVDPGVGTDRKSIVVKTKDSHYIVTPDNGTITFVEQEVGLLEAREIDETKHRLKNSENSHTFYGRDVYAYTGAKLASKDISFKDVGKKIDLKNLKRFNFEKQSFKKGVLNGTISILDVNYGNVWTNIDRKFAEKNLLKQGKKYDVLITDGKRKITIKSVPYTDTFGNVKKGEPVLYINSLDYVAIALNMDNFAKKYNIKYGPSVKVSILNKNNK